MLDMLRDMFRHQAWADMTLLNAVAAHETARTDENLLLVLGHILMVHRFFVGLAQGNAKRREPEVAPIDELSARFDEVHRSSEAWLDTLNDADLETLIAVPFFKGHSISLRDALLQIAMHSHGHRAQCLSRLRALTGKAPTLDYIFWSKDRPGSVPA